MTLSVKKLLCFSAFLVFVAASTIAQQQLCANAHNLIDKSSLSVPNVSWNSSASLLQVGCFQDTVHQPYWLKFTALTSGTFEFALKPKNLSADFDFILYSDACPCDTSATNIVACNWLGWVTQLFGSTGISSDPYHNFNVTDTLAWAEFEPTVQLQAGVNYYLLVDNITNNGVGFDIDFAGTAIIGKALPDLIPKINAISGNQNPCAGQKETYTVTTNTSFKEYQWIVPKDAKLEGTGKSVAITWGNTSGEIKVIAKTTCHKDSSTINVSVKSTPNLKYLDKDYFCKKTCFETKNVKINDLNNNSGLNLELYSKENDAWNGTSKNIAPDYICQAQSFWIRGTLSSGCFDTLKVDLKEVENPSVVLLGGGVACPGDSAQLVFSFTGKAPYQVTYTDGNENFSFVSNKNIYTLKKEIGQNTTYKITSFSEASNLCQTSVIGEARFYTPANCICLKRAGTMNPLPINACANGIAKSQHNGDHQAGVNDALAFILHSTPSPDLGTVYATANSPEFSFKSGLMYEKEYYISSVLGNKKNNGEINLSDPCLGISAGVPIVFHELPSAILIGDSIICKDALTDLTLKAIGKSPFKISFDANGNAQDLAVFNEIKIKDVPHGIYTITTIEDANSCSATNIDTLTIQAPKALTIKNKSFICNPNGNSYYITFEVEGGEKGTYYTKGQKGNFTNNVFKSEDIASGQFYIFMLKDANDCDSVSVTGKYTCDCTEKSKPGTMSTQPIVICASLSATASFQNDQVLAKNHIIGYVLKDAFGNVIAYNKLIPNFKFEAGMKMNEVYYISSVAGVNDGTGKVDLKSDCTTFSNATPITFVEEPSINFVSTDQTICESNTLDIEVQITGFPTFSLIYSDNNIEKTATGLILGKNILKLNPTKSSTYLLKEIKSEGIPGCKGTIGASNTLNINVADPISYKDVKINCSTDKKTFDVSFSLTGGGDNYLINGTPLSGNNFISSSFADASAYSFLIESKLNCKPITIDGKGYCSCPPNSKLIINTIVPIRCFGDKNGVLEATTTISQPNYLWSNGRNANTASNLKAGMYTVTVTNKDGCTLIDSVRLINPLELSATLNITSPKCNGENTGEILFEDIKGGTAPYTYSIDNQTFTNTSIFSKLKPLTYEVVVKDQKGCLWTSNATIDAPEDFYVELGNDMNIELGESVQLRAFINGTVKTLRWNSPELKKETETIKPMKTTKYEVFAESMTGCKVSDAVWVYVDKQRKVYVPTAFSPNGDNINDSFTIYGGNDVAKISNFKVYDRWGNLIYEQPTLESGDEAMGWQGTYRNYMANEGVYLYSAEILFIDGKSETIKGDVKLMK
jgi:gliding motility-associated-like protein